MRKNRKRLKVATVPKMKYGIPLINKIMECEIMNAETMPINIATIGRMNNSRANIVTTSFTSKPLTTLTSIPRRTEPSKTRRVSMTSLLNKIIVILGGWLSKSQSTKDLQYSFWAPSPRRTSPKFQTRESQCNILRLARVATTALEGLPNATCVASISVAHDGLTGLEQKNAESLKAYSCRRWELGKTMTLYVCTLLGYIQFLELSMGLLGQRR